MLTGTADLDELAAAAPTIPAFAASEVLFEGAICLQVMLEMPNASREAVLPASLHPTVPAVLCLQTWQIDESPWGGFAMMLSRVACRSGVRARGYTTRALVSSDRAVKGLMQTYGYPAVKADIQFRHGYDGADASATIGDQLVAMIRAHSPEPISPDDVQYTSTLNLAHTPNGLRLVQVEARHHGSKADRLTASLEAFDAKSLGSDLLEPRRLVSASLVTQTVEISPVRFVCKADELAFTGTEPATNH